MYEKTFLLCHFMFIAPFFLFITANPWERVLYFSFLLRLVNFFNELQSFCFIWFERWKEFLLWSQTKGEAIANISSVILFPLFYFLFPFKFSLTVINFESFRCTCIPYLYNADWHLSWNSQNVNWFLWCIG